MCREKLNLPCSSSTYLTPKHRTSKESYNFYSTCFLEAREQNKPCALPTKLKIPCLDISSGNQVQMIRLRASTT